MSAQIMVTGVADQNTYYTSATFTIVAQPGFTYSAFLNTNPVPVGVAFTVDEPDFYELHVIRSESATGAIDDLLVRFIVLASERQLTEVGLRRQVPWPTITSSPDEFSGAHLRVLASDRFPTGYEIPVVAWVEDESGHAVRGNGFATAAGHPSIQIRRGVGSGFLASNHPAGALNYAPAVQGLSTNKSIVLESNTTWTVVSGVLSGINRWDHNSRIYIITNLTLNAGATLSIGAGTIVRINPHTDITNNGTFRINGTRDRPVVFMPNARSQPWGGFIMRQGTGEVVGNSVIFTGSGAVARWFGFPPVNPNSKRPEQALFYLQDTQTVSLTDSAAISLAGQFGYARGAGAFVLEHFLLQRATSGGQFGGSLNVNDSAFIEFPEDTADFVAGDNNAFSIGLGGFTNSLIGWAKDDGIDRGYCSFQSCWFEGTFHHGSLAGVFANIVADKSVFIGCGLGVGHYSSSGGVTRCLLTDNQVGVRYQTAGVIATDCMFLHNEHDFFGYDRGVWTQAVRQITATNNFLTSPDTNYPNNHVWQPSVDAWRLGVFGARGHVGVGLAVRPKENTLAIFPDGIPVGLSMYCTNEVRVEYSILGTDGTSATGMLTFPPGKTRDRIPVPRGFTGVLRVDLKNSVNADITGPATLLFQNLPGKVLSPFVAAWKYLDDGSDQGTAWRTTAFDDSNWSNGVARLGFGPDANATTTIRRYLSGTSGRQVTNYYFRRAFFLTNDPSDFASLQFRYQRDDGCIVYLNGNALFTNNMPPGPVNFMTFAAATVGVTGFHETQQFWTNTFDATLLQPGTNILAVEVHQATSGSSDLLWEMELQALPSPYSRLNITRLGGEVVLYWNDSAFSLQAADGISGPWRPAVATNSPSTSPFNGTSFYRLTK
ncbi:MAG: hypothetical protein L0Y58_21090 [Verrucomicrobia subdivision 3 bacterium]|nr:hypothetical protein [Limisphaerales bacterium]